MTILKKIEERREGKARPKATTTGDPKGAIHKMQRFGEVQSK